MIVKKLAEYKPLAKIEEMEEQNYNMVDNVLNNGVGEKAQKEENKKAQVAEQGREQEENIKKSRGRCKDMDMLELSGRVIGKPRVWKACFFCVGGEMAKLLRCIVHILEIFMWERNYCLNPDGDNFSDILLGDGIFMDGFEKKINAIPTEPEGRIFRAGR